MRLKLVAVLLMTLLVSACQPNASGSPTPQPSPTLRGALVPTRIPTDTPTPTQTATNTPTATATDTATPTETGTPTATNTPTATLTNTPSATPTNTSTPTTEATSQPSQTPTSEAAELITQAEAALNNNQYSRAIELFTQVLETDPDNADVLMNRGFAYFQLEDTNKALDDFHRVMALDPTRATAFYNVGYILNQQQNYQEALDALNQAVTLEPSDNDAVSQRGLSYYFLQQYDKALDDFNTALEKDPNNADLLRVRGYTFAYLNQVDKACDDFKRYADAAGANADPQASDIATACTEGRDILPLIGAANTGLIQVPDDETAFTYSGNIDNTTYEARFSLNAKQGEVVGIQLKVDSGDLDPLLVLLDADGNELINNDDDPQGASGSKDSFIRDFAMPKTGKYTIVATRFQQDLGSTTGAFTLNLTRSEVKPVTPPPPGSDIPETIECGDTKTGTIDDTTYQVKYSFEAKAGAIIGVQLVKKSGQLDPYLRILDAGGTSLFENDDDPDGNGTSDSFLRDTALPEAGTYTIVATRFQDELGSTTGDFELTLTCAGS